jgi:WD40-like Beta Propeller Repeat
MREAIGSTTRGFALAAVGAGALVLLLGAAACNSNRGHGGGDGGGGGGEDGGWNGQQMKVVVIAPGAPQDAPSHFAGPDDPSAAPALVYPPDGVMMPPNINELEVQFSAASSTNLFELGFTSPKLDLKIYTPCPPVGGGCGFTPDEPTWKLLSDWSRGDTTQISLRATGPSGGVGTAATHALSFTDEDLLGGLYYWAAASGTINRYDFGRRGQTAENFYSAAQSGGICVGCHALSRDGSRIAVGLNIPGPATLRLLDVASRATLFESAGGPGQSGGSNFEALSPDGVNVLTSEGGNLVLRDSGSGAAVGANPAVANGTMPDWSADGTKVVFARDSAAACPIPTFCGVNPGTTAASLFLAPVTGTSFGAATQLVAGGSGSNSYYPSFSPDGNWVAFNRAAADSFDAMDARVMLVSTGAGAQPIDLATVNVVQGNSWPKFAPFVQHFQGKTVFWLTFSSRRDYGLRLLNSQQSDPSMRVSQIWMVAISPDRIGESGLGPDYPAFWLPFQDLATGNHIAQWTVNVARQPCMSIDGVYQCMPDETCENNVCVPIPIQ